MREGFSVGWRSSLAFAWWDAVNIEKVLCSESGMRVGMKSLLYKLAPWGKHFVAAALALVFLILSGSQNANALPAFARKYGLR
jgi:hypothetical protein